MKKRTPHGWWITPSFILGVFIWGTLIALALL